VKPFVFKVLRGISRLEAELRSGAVPSVLRLDWHEKNAQGQTAVRLRVGSSYLSRIFENLG